MPVSGVTAFERFFPEAASANGRYVSSPATCPSRPQLDAVITQETEARRPRTDLQGRDPKREESRGQAVGARSSDLRSPHLREAWAHSQPSMTLCTVATMGVPGLTSSSVRIGIRVAPNASNAS
jgi:hypothetical protein